MNTALARRLALGDRVIWMGKDDCQPSGPGTIIRITAHQVEVLWESEMARRYRRGQLYNLRHVETHVRGGGASLQAPVPSCVKFVPKLNFAFARSKYYSMPLMGGTTKTANEFCISHSLRFPDAKRAMA